MYDPGLTAQMAGVPEWTWIVLATLVGATIGAIVPYWLRIRRRKERIRGALHTEISSMAFDIEKWAETTFTDDPDWSESPIVSSNPFVSTVYEANAGEIGLLTDEEGEDIGEFYSLVNWYDKVLERYYNEGELPSSVTMVMLCQLPLLLNRLNMALQRLEENSNEKEVKDRDWPEFDSHSQIENHIQSNYDLNQFFNISAAQDWDLVKDK